MHVCMLSCFSHVWLFATLWSVGSRLLCPWDSPGKHSGVGCHALPQGIFPIKGFNLCLLHLLHYRWILLLLSCLGSPIGLLKYIKYSSLYSTVRPCYLSLLYIVVCICYPLPTFYFGNHSIVFYVCESVYIVK